MQICEWIFFGEGDLQLNGLMIKVIAVFFLFFFSPSPELHSWTRWDVRGGRTVRDQEIKKYKAILTA